MDRNAVEVHNRSLEERASAVTRAHCCEDCCILSVLSFEKGKQVVKAVMSSRENMDRTENKNDLREKIMVSIYVKSASFIAMSYSLTKFYDRHVL